MIITIIINKQKAFDIVGVFTDLDKNNFKLSQETRKKLLAVLSADLACNINMLNGNAVYVVESKELENRRRFPFGTNNLQIVTLGSGVVISSSEYRMQWLLDNLGHLDRDNIFSASQICVIQQYVERDGQYIAGPDIKFVADVNTFQPATNDSGLGLRIVHRDEIPDLYRYKGFSNALSYKCDTPRPDVLACTAVSEGTVIGVAGASMDCELMWQVGVDVIPEYRLRGIGKTLVSQLTAAILAEGKIPYYSTFVANIASQRLAISLGYQPTWIEIYSRNAEENHANA